MRTSSEVRNYAGDMPRIAPDWLRAWAEKRTWTENALLFRCDWLTDPMTEIRSKAARCRCTACGESFWTDWISGGMCRYGGAGDIRLWEEGKPKEVTDWQNCRCPECGAEVKARHLRSGSEYAMEYAYPMTLHRIPVKGEKDRLALVCWQVVKYFDGAGARHFRFHPYEAMAAEEKALRRITFHGGGFGGVYWLEGPHQCRNLQDMMQDVTEIVCPEGIEKAVEDTTCENAKLEIYLENGKMNFPTAWVRLWQKRGGKAESLLTCGAGGIVGNLIGQEKLNPRRTNYYAARTVYNTAFPQLKALDWKGRRPWEILRLRGKDELREAIALQERANLGGKTWQLWLEGRKAGKPWTLADAEALEGMKSPERIAATEISPAKAARYLAGQKRRWPEDDADEIMLTDYWTMGAEGYDMNDPANLWPDRLKREHDRLVARRKKEANAKQDAKIEEQARKLDRLACCLNGITIRPARSTAELEAEGKCLRHCVGSYAERVAKGETFIFFIRREAEPDMSWYTLNLDKSMKTVIQNRGMRNCDRTPEVQAFEDAWIAWVRAGAKRDKNGNPAINHNNKESAA